MRLNFRALQFRLLKHMKARVRNGEITERGLAKLTGFSQPHIHNVLNGIRPLTMEVADTMLRKLQIDLLELCAEDQGEWNTHSVVKDPLSRMVELLASPIGPGYPYPPRTGSELYPFRIEDLTALEAPVAARLAHDPAMAELIGRDAVALLDCSASCRTNPDRDSYYTVDLDGESAIRRVGLDTGCLYLLDCNSGPDRTRWKCIPCPERSLADVIRARVRIIVRHF
jgi:hypothetical protein